MLLRADPLLKSSKSWFLQSFLNSFHGLFFLIASTDSNALLLNIRDEDENDFILEQFQSFSGLVRWMWLGLLYDTDGMLEIIYWLFAF